MRSHLTRFGFVALGVLSVLGSSVSPLFAGVPIAPEIDASAFSAGLGLLAAGVLMVRARRRR